MKRAFTLVELLAVIAIVGILAALSIPAIQAIRESGRRTFCMNNIRQLSLAVLNYESSHGRLPPTLSERLLHWQAQCLPFLDQSVLYEKIKGGLPDGHPYDNAYFSHTIPILQCGSNPDQGFVIEANDTGALFAFTDYCGVAGSSQIADDGVFPLKANESISMGEITNGLSNTLMIGERPPNPIEHGFGMWLGSQWAAAASMSVTNTGEGIYVYPKDCGPVRFSFGVRFSKCDAFHHWSYHPGGANFARADGSVDFLNYDIETIELMRLGNRN